MAVINDRETKRRLPDGIVLEVVGGVWNKDLVIKTSDSTWARMRHGVEYSEEEMDYMVSRRQNNITPCPSDLLIFPAEHNERNVQVLADAAVKLRRDLDLAKDRQRTLERRNESARLALAGAEA